MWTGDLDIMFSETKEGDAFEESSDDEDMFQIPCMAPHPEAQYKWTDRDEEAMQLVLRKPLPLVVHTSTENRRTLVANLVKGIRLRHPSATPIHIVEFWKLKHVPTTVLAYTNTMVALFPRVKKAEGWQDHYKKVVLASNQYQPFTDQANVFSLEKMRDFLTKVGAHLSESQVVVVFTWLTASRYGDLRHMLLIKETMLYIKDHNLTVAIVDMKGSKGDPTGNRGDQKAIIFPTVWSPFITAMCVRDKSHVISSYRFKKALVEADAELTLHSGRRGASQTLARLGYDKKTIQDLTLHQQKERKETRSMDVYQNGLWLKDQREQNQLKMETHLLMQANLISPSTMQYVLEVWLKQVHSIAPPIAWMDSAPKL